MTGHRPFNELTKGFSDARKARVAELKQNVVEKVDRRKAALERIASLQWTLPPDHKFDRDEANER
jgi:hypothetical protein